MDYSTDAKEQMIKNYITSIDFSKDFSIKKIKEDIKKQIGEFPGIDVQWRKEEIIIEKGGAKMNSTVEAVKSITVAFSDGDDAFGRPRVFKMSYYV